MRLHAAIFAPIIFMMAGCFAAPRTISSIRAGVDSQGRPVVGDRAEYWTRSDTSGIVGPTIRGRRVVVTSFDVELVDLHFRAPTGRQMIFKPPPIPVGPLGALATASELIGLGRRSTWITEDDHRQLAAELREAFVLDLQRRGAFVVPAESLRACPGFARLPARDVIKSSPLLLLNPIGSDTGQVMHTRTVAAPGLGVRRRWGLGRDAAEVQILGETGADLAMDVCLRVGTFDNKAALQHRSTIRLTTADGTATLKARRTVLSDANVTDGESWFVPVAGRTIYVRPADLSRELQALLPEFLSMAMGQPAP